MALERLDISGNALEESGISELARALVASDSIQFVQLASHPLPIQQLMAGGDIEIDGQKLTDFDLQLILEVVGSSAQRPDALDDDTGSEVVVDGGALGGRVDVPKRSCAGGAGGAGGAGCKASSGYVSYTPSPVASPTVSPLKQMPVMIPSMSIGYNAITEKGASLLARSISSGRVCIQRLNLRGNKIGRDGAVALLEGLMVAHSPTSLLDLSDNQVR
jgi:hypothetical protein